VVTPCSVAVGYQCFRGPCCLPLAMYDIKFKYYENESSDLEILIGNHIPNERRIPSGRTISLLSGISCFESCPIPGNFAGIFRDFPPLLSANTAVKYFTVTKLYFNRESFTLLMTNVHLVQSSILNAQKLCNEIV